MKIYQIETSAYCTASCSYCPHSKMTRLQGNMSFGTFKNAIREMDNNYCALHHFGEPFQNEFLASFISYATKQGIKIEFSTNGSYLSIEQLEEVMKSKPYMIRYAWDAFRSNDFLKKLTTMNKSTIIKSHSVHEGTKLLTNFAGQMKGKSEIKGECFFRKYKYVCVLWDGRIVPCCCDYDGKEIIGDVNTGELNHKPTYDLCKNCDGIQFAEDGLWEETI